MVWRFSSQTKSKWYFWKSFESSARFFFLPKTTNRVVLNGQHSSWDNVIAKVPQGSILGSLLFFIYTNNLSNDLSVDDTPLFSVVNNIHTSATSQDLDAVTNWAFQWKMIFNPDLSKQAQEVIFSRKVNKLLHPTILFNNIPLRNSLFQNISEAPWLNSRRKVKLLGTNKRYYQKN